MIFVDFNSIFDYLSLASSSIYSSILVSCARNVKIKIKNIRSNGIALVKWQNYDSEAP